MAVQKEPILKKCRYLGIGCTELCLDIVTERSAAWGIQPFLFEQFLECAGASGRKAGTRNRIDGDEVDMGTLTAENGAQSCAECGSRSRRIILACDDSMQAGVLIGGIIDILRECKLFV